MALNIYTSATVRDLTDRISKQIQTNKNVFIPDIIVTSNTGINNWLKIQLAEANDIAANLVFTKHEEYIKMVYKLLQDDKNNKRPLTKSYLHWLIYGILGSEKFRKNFADKYNYYDGDQLKKYALSERLASLFQNYQMYIADELNDSKNEWQGYIWNQINELSNDRFVSINGMAESISIHLQKPEKQELLKLKLPTVHFFLGLDFTNYHLQVYKGLSEFIDINFYVFSPFDNTGSGPANPLAENWGLLARNAFNALNEVGSLTTLPPKELKSNTLLGKIQSDIRLNAPHKSKLKKDDIDDNSLIINSCYTPAREVEVLYNYLVKTLDENPMEIGARDILVMMPNADKYAPAIKGIFESAKVKIPYSIADSPYSAADSIYNAIEALLNMDEQFKAESVVQLLESKYVRAKFEIEDVEFIRSLVREANIRFGVEGNIAIQTNTVSWRNGLQRLLYGYCMSGEERYKVGGKDLKLLDLVEGGSAMELIRLNTFFEKLVASVEERNTPKKLDEWTVHFNHLIENFIHDENNDELVFFQKRISELNLISDFVDEAIPYKVIKDYLIALVSSEDGRSSFASKGISFCSMSQMRNVPYKIIATLGMNLNDFPRKETALSYDLLQDRSDISIASKKEEDKFLFLQTLISAEKQLYISYIGRNIKDNSYIPPSSLVDELADYINEGIGSDVKLIYSHPLHGFSSSYFSNTDPRYYTYLYNNIKPGKAISTKQVVEEQSTVEISEFVAFFRNPIQYYYNRVLGIYYNETVEILSDTEVFEIDNIQKWILKNQYVRSTLDLDKIQLEAIERGGLSLQTIGAIELEDLFSEVDAIKTLYTDEILGSNSEKIYVDVPLDSFAVVGPVGNIYGDKFIVHCISKGDRKFKNALDFYITYLLLVASGNAKEGVFISDAGAKRLAANSHSEEEAIEQLEILMVLYQAGIKNILPFTLELKWKTLKELREMDFKSAYGAINEDIIMPNSYCSEYLITEFKNGFFTEDRIKEFKTNIDLILTGLFELF